MKKTLFVFIGLLASALLSRLDEPVLTFAFDSAYSKIAPQSASNALFLANLGPSLRHAQKLRDCLNQRIRYVELMDSKFSMSYQEFKENEKKLSNSHREHCTTAQK